MNGLEEIVLAIKQKAAAEGEEIKKRARREADNIRDEAAAVSASESEKLSAEADRRCEQIIEAAYSAAVSNRSKEILKYKSSAVRRVIDGLLAELRSLPEDKYFELIEKLIYTNSHKGEKGVVSFGKKYAGSIPAGFMDKVNGQLAEKGAALTRGEDADMQDGFILSYGDIEENCGFEAIISSREDELKDEIASILFA